MEVNIQLIWKFTLIKKISKLTRAHSRAIDESGIKFPLPNDTLMRKFPLKLQRSYVRTNKKKYFQFDLSRI